MQRVTGEPISSENGQGTAHQGKTRELSVRIYSALILVAVALFLTLTSLESFAVLITLFIAAMAWEWGRLVRNSGFDAAFFVQLAATAIASWATVRGCLSCALFAVILGTIGVFAVRAFKDERPQAWWSAAGVYYAGLPAIALIWLRSDAAYGWQAILYIFAIVWTTDSAAYVFGRWLGGPKLAPRISPKKTWSGLIGGALAAGLAGLIFGILIGESNGRLALLAIGLAAVAQLGDLGESALKRVFGMKDSSGLIPGHGGVLDRIDGLVVVAVAAGIIAWSLDPANPGRALLLWP
ncbi:MULTISPECIES: phosphatidate cytidylyltransferase [Rhodomicrobium]|uniref:phosphatidate cytidylyltransferase n=1 Tax=Rhodomicrobium TaxID=1068 RepID=UPI000B4AB370|nr:MULTISPECIES: phosphatidate cytidylyltransferase [Rhodomicrobium]